MIKNAIISIGFIFSFIVNFYMNFHHGSIFGSKVKVFFCLVLPIGLTSFLAVLTFFMKLILADGASFQKWDCVEAREIVRCSKLVFKRILAKFYLAIDFPTLFFGGYVMGCAFFVVGTVFSRKFA